MKSPLARVRALAMKLPDVEEGTTFGYPAFKVRGATFAWFPKKKEVEPDSLGARMSILEREHRIARAPKIYYVTPHYQDYPAALARVELMTDAALRELLESAHEFVATAKPKKKPKRRG
jgi:hypothetical protein